MPRRARSYKCNFCNKRKADVTVHAYIRTMSEVPRRQKMSEGIRGCNECVGRITRRDSYTSREILAVKVKEAFAEVNDVQLAEV